MFQSYCIPSAVGAVREVQLSETLELEELASVFAELAPAVVESVYEGRRKIVLILPCSNIGMR
jgi:hypothetical protein